MVRFLGLNTSWFCGPTRTVWVVGPASVLLVVVDGGIVPPVRVVVVVVGGAVRPVMVVVGVAQHAATTASTNSSTVASSASTCPTVAQPGFFSAFAKALSNAVSLRSMHSASTPTAFNTALAWQT